MKVYKFGGASVRDAVGIRNVAQVLSGQGFGACLVVVSAMGKTTNALEKVVAAYFNQEDYALLVQELAGQHRGIAQELLDTAHPVFEKMEQIWVDLLDFLSRNKSPNYDFVYDQVVSIGEMISSVLLSAYLGSQGLAHQWLDARDYLKTDATYREGGISWPQTQSRIASLDPCACYVTQGFIASDPNQFTTTLGREGSDYSAAIFAYGLQAESMTIWKDVPGVMTGDPRIFSEVELLEDISYEEAIELAYYGASVIHPKTLQPLKQKEIPFYVKSFLDPDRPGTRIGPAHGGQKAKESFILKKDQHLLRVATRDFSFASEQHIRDIFAVLSQHRVRVSLMQNSAISLSLCLEDKYGHLPEVRSELEERLSLVTETQSNLSLFTVRHANPQRMEAYYQGKTVVMEQLTQATLQLVIE